MNMNNNQAWDALFHRYNILENIRLNGSFQISANQIKDYREPRLMTKFDSSAQLPTVFRDNNLSILPITRGDYVLSDIKTFEILDVSEDVPIIEKSTPTNIESLDFAAISSEALAINCAYITNILSDFLEEENLLPTVSGRMKSDVFSFNIQKQDSTLFLPISVNNSQIEIDGGFEGDTSLVLLEAKNNICSEFMIRQLYYPFRKWSNLIRKPVRPVFLEYSNGIFHLREYRFADVNNYNSLTIVREKKYRLRDSQTPINAETLFRMLESVREDAEPQGVPFPQADSFERVVSLCEILFRGEEEAYTKEILNFNMEFTGRASFTSRQVDYYTNAGIYLGLVEKVYGSSPVSFRLSERGRYILGLRSISERQLRLIETIISHQAFARVLRCYLEHSEVPSKERIVEIMQDCGLQNMGTDGMYNRRASTVKSWVQWIIGTMTE